jgi:phenylalanyl-tRNA synthetase alpha chain
MNLHVNEVKVLQVLGKLKKSVTVNDIIKDSDLAHSAVMRAVLTLKSENLVKIYKTKHTRISLNEEGARYVTEGLPERKLILALKDKGGKASLNSILTEVFPNRKIGAIALGWLMQKGCIKVNNQQQNVTLIKNPSETQDEKLLKFINANSSVLIENLNTQLRKAVPDLKKRKIVKIHEEFLKKIKLTELGFELIEKGIEIVDEISQLTPELISTGNWSKIKLKEYNIKASSPRIYPGKKHPYLKFLDQLKEKLVVLGFKEMKGPIVELSFFNCDALYMPQDHPAREVHDMYFLKEPKYGDLNQYNNFLKNVKKVHENGWKTKSKGWRYSFSIHETSRLILRSQTTATSARMLVDEKLEIPGKYFSVARCFRPDVVDRTHLTEFNQVEGIILDEDLSLRDLLGVLKKFAFDIAKVDKVKFRPDYFPFTEPSVELVAYKKGYGWMEFGGSGIFRPELTLPLGIKVPVLAWGLGVDRLFMMKKGIDDIRQLFSQDLKWLRQMELS